MYLLLFYSTICIFFLAFLLLPTLQFDVLEILAPTIGSTQENKTFFLCDRLRIGKCPYNSTSVSIRRSIAKRKFFGDGTGLKGRSAAWEICDARVIQNHFTRWSRTPTSVTSTRQTSHHLQQKNFPHKGAFWHIKSEKTFSNLVQGENHKIN
jgi:hypothetical protein